MQGWTARYLYNLVHIYIHIHTYEYGKVTAKYFRASDHAEVIAPPSKVVSNDMSPESPDRAWSRSASHSNSSAKGKTKRPLQITQLHGVKLRSLPKFRAFSSALPHRKPQCPAGLSSLSSACQLSIVLCLQCLLGLRSNLLLTCQSFRPLISVCP